MSVYELAKDIIESGNYDYAVMKTRLDAFLLYGRITPEQYAELIAMMDAQQNPPQPQA